MKKYIEKLRNWFLGFKIWHYAYSFIVLIVYFGAYTKAIDEYMKHVNDENKKQVVRKNRTTEKGHQ